MLKPGRPRHEQISDALRAQIESGELDADDQLPSESRLGEQFGVSRITVRRALQTLESESLIYRRQGLGSFVRSPVVQQGLVHLTDFVEDMVRAGLSPSSEVVGQESEAASATVAVPLGINPGEVVYRIDRVRLGDGEPVAFDRTWLPAVYGNLFRGRSLGSDTIYRVLENEFGIPVIGGRYRIESVNARADVAEHLAVPWGRALLLIQRTSWTTGGKPLYYQHRYYRSDRVAFELELARDPGGRRGRPEGGGMPLREFEPVFTKGSERG